MELHAVITALIVDGRGKGRAAGGGDDAEARRQRGDMVTMAHPDGAESGRPFVKQIARLGDIQRRAAKFGWCRARPARQAAGMVCWP